MNKGLLIVIMLIVGILAGTILSREIYFRYPDVLFDDSFEDEDGLRDTLIYTADNYAGDKCARISPKSFYNALSFAKTVGYANVEYSSMEGCESFDYNYNGTYAVVYYPSKEEFCKNK